MKREQTDQDKRYRMAEEIAGIAQSYAVTLCDGDADDLGLAILDAILPQITTVEELDDLYLSGDRRTVLIDSRGYPHRIGLIAAEVVERYGPLTVVWRPE